MYTASCMHCVMVIGFDAHWPIQLVNTVNYDCVRRKMSDRNQLAAVFAQQDISDCNLFGCDGSLAEDY
jgi:hypothetical protein